MLRLQGLPLLLLLLRCHKQGICRCRASNC